MDLVNNMFLGAAYGDAAGAPFEVIGAGGAAAVVFDGTFSQSRTFTDRYRKIDTVFGPGFVTDDTSMCFVARNVVDEGWTREKAILAYQAWAASSFGRFMGKNTRALFGGVKTMKGYETRVAKQNAEASQGNGCLMRTPAFATLSSLKRCLKASREDCFLTNPNEESLRCCDVQVTMLYCALQGMEAADIWKFVQEKFADFGPVASVVAKTSLDKGDYSPSIRKTKGWVSVAVFCSVWALRKIVSGCNPEDVLKFVVQKSLDSDSTGSITGALVGALGHEFNEDNVRIMTEKNPWILDRSLPIEQNPEAPAEEEPSPSELLAERRKGIIKSLFAHIKSIGSCSKSFRAENGICLRCCDLADSCPC